jgi:Ca-activated chloride channel family protein
MRILCFLRSGLITLAVTAGLCAMTCAQTAPADGGSNSPSQPTTGVNQEPVPAQSAQPSAPAQDAQQEPQPEQPSNPDSSGQDAGRFVFRKQVQEVVLHATVVDASGQLVTSLDRNAFSVFQNGAAEQITSFRREDVPVAMGIVIDNSGSMRDKRERVNQSVLNLIHASNPQDEIFVVNFGQTSYLDQDFTSDVNLLQAALHKVSTRGSTALYDAVVASANHLRNDRQLNKKVLLVVTDGQDNMSRETLQEAMHDLQPSKGVTVYAIGLTDEGFTPAAREALQRLASSTGGVAFFPQSLDEVDSITRTVAHDIRSQYTLAYKPPGSEKGYQTIRVEARSSQGQQLTVRTRTGYYPGESVR